jgi:ribosome recycling factor
VAQQELRIRIQACLKSAIQPTKGITEDRDQWTGQLQTRKEELRKSLDQVYKQVVKQIDAYVQQEWSPDERMHREKDIQTMKQYVGRCAEAVLDAIGKAKTIKRLDILSQELSDQEQRWYHDALKQIMR